MKQNISNELLEFIENSPTAFHAVKTMADQLTAAGFKELKENKRWELHRGEAYFVTRNDSSLIAFVVSQGELNGMHILASHSDSPTFKIKENPEMEVENHYIKLNVERYGGMLCAPWFDRPLSIAGRVIVKDPSTGRFISKLVNIDRDLVLIPNLAIHMNREANNGYKYNAQKDLLPLYGTISSKGSFMELIASAANVSKDEILGHDLFLYNRQKGSVWGAENEFISCGRLDDLQCAFASFKGLLAAFSASSESADSTDSDKNSSVSPHSSVMPVHCVFDNEEVGSGTKQGADSGFLSDTLLRIHKALGYDEEDLQIHLADSLMISADNAHAVHPNYTEKADPTNRPYVNEGIVIKFNANQKYCTDAVSAAMFRDLCNQADVSVQTFTNRSDIAGGSTLGNISNTHVALNTVDIGLPQLAMHSPYETAGVKDTEDLVRVAARFFNYN